MGDQKASHLFFYKDEKYKGVPLATIAKELRKFFNSVVCTAEYIKISSPFEALRPDWYDFEKEEVLGDTLMGALNKMSDRVELQIEEIEGDKLLLEVWESKKLHEHSNSGDQVILVRHSSEIVSYVLVKRNTYPETIEALKKVLSAEYHEALYPPVGQEV